MRAGVTLLELLVAVAITVIVGASIIGALYSGRSAWEAGQNIIDRHQNARAAIDFISRDLQQAVVFSDGAVYRACFRSDGSYLVFTAMGGDPSQGFELSWVAYRLNGNRIERALAPYDDFGDSPVVATDPIAGISWDFQDGEVAWDIESLSFDFYDLGQFHEDWEFDSNVPYLPERIEIRIAAADSGEVTASVKMPLSRLTPYVGQ